MGAVVPLIAGIGKFFAANAGTILGGTAAAASAVGALKGGPKMPEAPKTMPMPDAAAGEEARRRKLAEEYSRSGRAATILGGSGSRSDTLG